MLSVPVSLRYCMYKMKIISQVHVYTDVDNTYVFNLIDYQLSYENIKQ